jgi:hypothetical protein
LVKFYTASVKRSPGRKALNVEFRHPLRNDSRNRPGKKVHKALGTDNQEDALALVDLLNQLLRNETLWSSAGKIEATRLYGDKVAEIFYGGIEPSGTSAFDLDDFLPLPSTAEGYSKVLLIGVPGAGKTTLIRQLLGTNPKTERFPATSINRTTTFLTELVLREHGNFNCAVTFMSEYEARFEVEEALTAAVSEAIEGRARDVASVFLEKSDMRFRLKYILGDLETKDELDPYAETDAEDQSADIYIPSEEYAELQRSLHSFIEQIISIALVAKEQFELANGSLTSMQALQRSVAFDEIVDAATNSDEFLDLVSAIMGDLRQKFDEVSDGDFKKTTTGWPVAWHFSSDSRDAFIESLRVFSDNNYRAWGKLLSPLVRGMRVEGPFRPAWSDVTPKLILIDTEGLGHKADTSAELSEGVLPLLDAADVVLLVESAKSGMTNISAGKALEGVVNTGHTRKLGIAFTGMDLVKGDNLKGRAKFDHVFSGLRNVIENQIAKNVSADAARALLGQLRDNTFYLGNLDQFDPRPAVPELIRMVSFATAFNAQDDLVVFPSYRDDRLGFAIQEAAKEFRELWQGYLGLAEGVRARHYNSIKAMTRRYAEGFDDGYELRPHSNFLASLRNSISRFLEVPETWSGNPTQEQKRATIDLIKTKVSRTLPSITLRRLRDRPRHQWQDAYSLRGVGTTKPRANKIEAIFGKSVPIPTAASADSETWEFVDEIREVVEVAIEEVRDEVARSSGANSTVRGE